MDHGGRILVVSGDERAAARVAGGLSGVHRCVVSSTGGEAYVRVRRMRFDVVISDAELPDMTGLEFLDGVRDLHGRPTVVLISRGAPAEWVRHAFKRGAYDVLSGERCVDEIQTVVANAIARRGAVATTRDTSGSAMDAGRDRSFAFSGSSGLASSLEHLRGACRQENTRASVLVVDVDVAGGGSVRGVTRRSVAGVIRQLPNAVSDAIDALGEVEPGRSVVALRDKNEDEAVVIAERIRDAVRERLPRDAHGRDELKLRVGVASSQLGFIETADDLIERAAAASVRAKEQGGNQVVRWSRVSSQGPSRRQIERASVEEVSGWISRTRQQLKRGYIESTMALVAAVEAKEPHTRDHARVVSRYCEEIGRRMELPPVQIEALRTAALLHDVGKIGVPDAILQKPGPLTDEEFEVVKRHPETAIEILGHTSHLRAELPYILHHHEQFDGSGYPAGLRGEEIPLGARILNVGDSLDAMLSTRCYKRGMSIERVADELDRCAGAQFDPEVARVAREWLVYDRDAVAVG